MTDAKNEAAGGASTSDAELGTEAKPRHLYCTFCGRRDDEVALLIACAAEAKICDNCVRDCNEILSERGIPITVPNA